MLLYYTYIIHSTLNVDFRGEYGPHGSNGPPDGPDGSNGWTDSPDGPDGRATHETLGPLLVGKMWEFRM